MRFDLKRPCKNCPFSTAPTRIVFACAARAEEIAESAYRNGFPCHLSAEHQDEDNARGQSGFYPGPQTQHCAGALMMFLQENDCWPGIDNDEELAYRLWGQMDFDANLHFESEDDFIEANTKETP